MEQRKLKLLLILFVCFCHVQTQEPILYQWPHCTIEAFNERREIYYRCEAPTPILYVEMDGTSWQEHFGGIRFVDKSSNTICERRYKGVDNIRKCTKLNIMVESGLKKEVKVAALNDNNTPQKIQLNLTFQSQTATNDSEMSCQNSPTVMPDTVNPLAYILPCVAILLVIIVVVGIAIVIITIKAKRRKTSGQNEEDYRRADTTITSDINTTINSETAFTK